MSVDLIYTFGLTIFLCKSKFKVTFFSKLFFIRGRLHGQTRAFGNDDPLMKNKNLI